MARFSRKEKSKSLQKMRIVYAIAGLFLALAIVAIILGFLAMNQLQYNQPTVTNGLSYVSYSYHSSDVPMTSMGLIFSANKTKAILFTDNLYILDLTTSLILWKALSTPILSATIFLTLSPFGTLSLQTLSADSSNVEEIWTNETQGNQDAYSLTVTNDGNMQVSSVTSSQILWSTVSSFNI